MIQDHLRRFPRFDRLTAEQVRGLERIFEAKRYRTGQTLIREGDSAAGPSASVYLILEGSAALGHRDTTGRFCAARTVGPGELIGLIAVLRDTRRTATVQIERPALIARIDRRGLETLRAGHPATWSRFQEVIALQLAADFRAMHQRLGDALWG